MCTRLWRPLTGHHHPPPHHPIPRYFIRVTITRNYKRDVKEQDFVVQVVQPPPTSLTAIKMEVGIEECLHIEFEYDKQK